MFSQLTFRTILKRIQSLFFRVINYVSFEAVRLRFRSQSAASISRNEKSKSKPDCRWSASNCSDDSDSDMNTNTNTNININSINSINFASARSRNKRQNKSNKTGLESPTQFKHQPDNSVLIANSAVSHSYEDITDPNYHNFLWLSSQWDRSDLSMAFYFLPNWFQYFNDLCYKDEQQKRTDGNAVKLANSTFNATTAVTNSTHIPFTSKIFSITIWKRNSPCRSFLNFLHQMSRLPDSFFPKRRISVPKRLLKTLIIDLDETMIHATANTNSNSSNKFDFIVEVLINRTSCLYYVYKRPHLNYFLDVVSNWYNLVVYTASVREYADPVIDLIDNNRRYFKNRLFRSSCPQAQGQYFKDLSLVDSDLSKVCLLDNSAASFALYPDNAIPIESWRDDGNDEALLELLPFLDALRFVEDVRSILSLRRLINYGL